MIFQAIFEKQNNQA